MTHSTSIPPEVYDNVRNVLASLDAEMKRVAEEDGAPSIHTHLELLNNNLRRNPELIHLLSEEEIAPYYKAVIAKADIVLAPVKAKAKAKAETKEKDAFVQENINNLFGF